ncbi:Calmodulin-binding transcription activator 1 [Chionoecetes opilio]|uniref:Calmodulin-binding transcription activator 1 n=1 Tax=Chionoecetes opilio TaxID=41210 RepID=A0A8J5CWV4_CHIOP|nr:Calmodulin-binding transcription activator 1 [Chionoecetes opilio]
MLLYSRKKVRYRRDGYCWKKRKDGKTTREDHMKLKVQGIESGHSVGRGRFCIKEFSGYLVVHLDVCIYGCYVHSAILPTFHRRCYWLLQASPSIMAVKGVKANPDIVLVHYLNVPYPDDNKLVMASSISLWADKKEWTKEELISQLKPMCKCKHLLVT